MVRVVTLAALQAKHASTEKAVQENLQALQKAGRAARAAEKQFEQARVLALGMMVQTLLGITQPDELERFLKGLKGDEE